jgi:hypothetical protein
MGLAMAQRKAASGTQISKWPKMTRKGRAATDFGPAVDAVLNV